MKLLIPVICSVIFIFSFPALSVSYADIVVIANRANPVQMLTKKQVVDIYMGRQSVFQDGSIALPIDQSPDSQIRNTFYRLLIGKSIAQVNAYWAKILFTGRATPPRVLPNENDIYDSILKNRDAIAYVDDKNVNAEVKIVFRLDQTQ